MAKGKYAPELSVLNARKAFMESAFQSTNVVSSIPTEEKMLCSSKKYIFHLQHCAFATTFTIKWSIHVDRKFFPKQMKV
jgi:hypothetical protein